jgi:hypothetical protein
MYNFFLNSKKSPGLPILKVKLDYNRKNNLEKKLTQSLLDLSKETEILVLGNDYFTKKEKNKNKQFPIYKKNNNESRLEKMFKKIENPQSNTQKAQIKKLNITKFQKMRIQSARQILAQKLNKITSNLNAKKKIMKTSEISNDTTKTNNFNNYMIKNYNYVNDDSTNRKIEKIKEINTTRNTLNKYWKQEKNLFKKILNNKNMKNNSFKKIRKITSILNDSSKKYNIINHSLKNYSHKNSFIKIKKQILNKSLKQSKSQDDINNQKPLNFRRVLDKSDNLLGRPLKQIRIKEDKKNKIVWVKKSTANLLSFGQISQSMNDELFYLERKRIINNYIDFEKEADLYFNKNAPPKDYRRKTGMKNIEKIDKLLNQNLYLIKTIVNK